MCHRKVVSFLFNYWLEKVMEIFLQDRCGVVTANGSSPLENLRGLEHYLNDIMSPQGSATDIKGKFSNFI